MAKSIQEVWQTHKDLLRSADCSLPVNWDCQLPNDQEACKLLVLRGKKWTEPQEPVVLDDSSLQNMVYALIPQVQETYGAEIGELPALKLVAPEEFLPTLNHYQIEVNERFGYGSQFVSPPAMGLFALQGMLVIPDRFVVRKLSKNETDIRGSFLDCAQSNVFETMDLAWDRPFLEETLAGLLSCALLRQARGEWNEDYVTSMAAVGYEAETTIGRIMDMSTQIATEQLCTLNPQWGFYVATDAIHGVWGDRFKREIYIGIDALSKQKSLGVASMVDDVGFTQEGKLAVTFCKDHPFDSTKRALFNETDN